MKSKKTLLTIALFAACFTWTAGGQAKATFGSGQALCASPQGMAEDAFVRVTVRFANARALPAADARIVREIGYGTMLRVLEKNGDYLRVAPLGPSASSAADPWYVLISEVETTAATAADAVVETRSVTFTPIAPAAGQPLIFTASRFRTPNLLKWDMGDGTVLTSGGKVSRGENATLSYAYAAAGTYQVRVYDDGGKADLPPVTVQVTVSAHARSLSVRPEQPLANHPLAITALHFRQPEKIAWDMGDGTLIAPGAGPAGVKPTFQVSHTYKKAGTYVIQAYDSGDKAQAPIAAEIRVAADPRLVRVKPDAAVAGLELAFNAVNFNTPDRLRWDMGDGTWFPRDNEIGVLVGAAVSHRYARPGVYTVKVYDWSGDRGRLPVEFAFEVGAAVPVAGSSIKPGPMVDEQGPLAGDPPRRRKYSLIKIGPYAGYFQPQAALIKEIYGDGDVTYGARLGVHIWQGFHFWLSAAQYQVIGKTTFTEDKTTLTLLPLSFFLRYNIGRGFFSPYAGVGYTFLNFKEEAEFVGNVKGNGSNFSVEGGFEIRVNRHFFIDLGARFDQIKIIPENFDEEIDLGGLQAGISLLISF